MDRVNEARSDYLPRGDWTSPLFYLAPEAMAVVTLDGRIRAVNGACERLLGAVGGAAIDELLHPDDLPAADEHLAGLRAGRGFNGVEARVLAADGYRWVECSAGPLNGAEALVIARDITGRRREQRLNDALFASSGAAIVVLGADGCILRFNRAAELLSGYRVDEVAGRPVWEVLVDPSQAEKVRSAAVGEGGTRSYTVRWRTKSGGAVDLICSSSAVAGEDGTPECYVGTAVDITGWKATQRRLEETEDRYQRLIELGFSAEIIQCAGLIVHINQAGAELLGADSAAPFIGRPLTDVYVPEQHALVSERVRRAVEQWEPTPLAERTLCRLDGRQVPVEVMSVPIVHDGRPATQAVFRDVSSRKKVEQELAQYRERLEELVTKRTTQLLAVNRELESFAYSVAHDLRAPLRAINGFSAALLEDWGSELAPAAHRYLERIRINTERMAGTIDNLMILSKVNRHAMAVEAVDLAELARSVVEELRIAEPERQVDLSIPGSLAVRGDGTLLRIVLQNLIGNAWKYSGKRPQARIEFDCTPRGGQAVYFVRDNGVGFDMAHAENLFTAFTRLHSPQEFDGSGIGLATVKRIIHRHGGQVWAEAEEGVGATFFFTVGNGSAAEMPDDSYKKD